MCLALSCTNRPFTQLRWSRIDRLLFKQVLRHRPQKHRKRMAHSNGSKQMTVQTAYEVGIQNLKTVSPVPMRHHPSQDKPSQLHIIVPIRSRTLFSWRLKSTFHPVSWYTASRNRFVCVANTSFILSIRFFRFSTSLWDTTLGGLISGASPDGRGDNGCATSFWRANCFSAIFSA